MSFLDGLFTGGGEGGDPLAISDVVLSGSGTIAPGLLHLVQGADTATVLTLVAAAVEDVAGQRFAVKVTSPAPTPPGGELIVSMPSGMVIEGDDGLFAGSASLSGRQDAGNYREWKCDAEGTWHMLAGGFGDVAPHGAAHEAGGADELDVTGLPGQLDDPQTVAVAAGGVVVGARPEINFKAGGGVSIGVSDDAAADRMNVTVNVIARGLVISDQPMIMTPGVQAGPIDVTPDHVYRAERSVVLPTLLTVSAGLTPADIHGHRIGIFTVGGARGGGAADVTFLVPGGEPALIQNPHALTGPAVSLVSLPYVGYSEWVFDQDGEGGAGLWRVLTWIDDAAWVTRALLESGEQLALQIAAIPSGGILHRQSDGQAVLLGGPARMDEAGNISSAGTVNGVTVQAHAARHANGGADKLNVAGLSGELADMQKPKIHSASHTKGGFDELIVTGLIGELADAQKPKLGNTVEKVQIQAADPGDALTASRTNHKHDILTGFPVALAVGGANVAGLSAALAPADHKHGLPAFGSAAGTFCEGNDTRLTALVAAAAFRGNQCRLSGESANPVMLGTSASISTIYFLPFIGDLIGLYNIGGVAGWRGYQVPSAGVSLPLSGMTANRPHDVFMNAVSGTAVMELVPWTSNTARATALQLVEGVYVKNGDSSRRYVGTIFARSATTISFVNGEPAKCDIWNADNRVPASFFSGAPWSAGGTSVNTANVWQPYISTSWCELVVGLVGRGDVVAGRISIMVSPNSQNAQAAVGWDSTSNPLFEQPYVNVATGAVQLIAEGRTWPLLIGTHYLSYLIRASSTAAKFFWQDSGYSGSFRTDLYY